MSGLADAAHDSHFQAARLAASRAMPYLASAIFAMAPVEDERTPTAAVDREWRLYLGPPAFDVWSVAELAGVIVHEANHLIRDHFSRAQRRGISATDRQRWNIATDCAINDDLHEAKIVLPAGACHPNDFGFDTGLLEEEYFELLGRGADSAASGSTGSKSDSSSSSIDADHGSGVDGIERSWDQTDTHPAPGISPRMADLIRHEVAEATERYRRSRGSVPSGLQKWVEARGKSRTPWPMLLRTAIQHSTRRRPGIDFHTWSRASRRADVMRPFLVPGRISHQPRVSVVIDTSASMHEALLRQALAETRALCRATGAEVSIISCDAEATLETRKYSGRSIALRGGGWTDLRVGIELASTAPVPDVIVVVTDGHTPWPAEMPFGSRGVLVILDRRAPEPTVRGAVVVRADS